MGVLSELQLELGIKSRLLIFQNGHEGSSNMWCVAISGCLRGWFITGVYIIFGGLPKAGAIRMAIGAISSKLVWGIRMPALGSENGTC
jgi:hypothetical protein